MRKIKEILIQGSANRAGTRREDVQIVTATLMHSVFSAKTISSGGQQRFVHRHHLYLFCCPFVFKHLFALTSILKFTAP